MKLNINKKRSQRVRRKLKRVSSNRFRLTVFKSTKNLSAQIIDDLNNKTILSSSSNDKDLKKEIAKCKGKISKSTLVGKHLGEKLKEKKIKEIIFDRNGYNYHGRVKALADAVREMKIKF